MQAKRPAIIAALLFASMILAPAFSPRLNAQTDEAHQQFLFAYKLLQRGEDDLAVEAFEKFALDYPYDAKSGDAAYYLALLAQRRGDHEQVVYLLRNPIKTEHVPEYAVDLLRGQVHSDRGEFDHALAALERIDVKTVNDPTIAAAMHQLAGNAYRALGNLNGAVEALRQAADLDSPLKGRAIIDLARVHIIRGQHDQAIQTLEECLALGDTTTAPEAARLAGDQCYKLKQYPQAIRYYRMVVSRHQSTKHFHPAVLGVMWAQFSDGEYDALTQTHQQHVENLGHTHRLTAKYLLGSAHLASGKFDEALGAFESIASQAAAMPIHDELLFKTAQAQYELSQFDAMSKTLTQLFKAHPESRLNLDGQFLLAAADAKAGQFNAGVDRLTAIIEYRPKHPYHDQALLQRAGVHQKNNQLQKSADDYLRYFALPGKIDDQGRFLDHESVLRLLDLQYQLGQYDAVDKTATRLSESGAGETILQEAMYRRALALVKLNRTGEAIEALTKLIQKHPESSLAPQWLYWRGLLLVGAQKREEALSDLQRAAKSVQLSEAQRVNALRMTSLAMREAGRNDQAVEQLLEMKKQVGLTAADMFWLARYYADRSQPKEAIAFLEPLLEDQRQVSAVIRGKARFLAGKCYHEAEQHDLAKAVFRKLITDRHVYAAQAQLALAGVLHDTGDLKEAIKQYQGLHAAQSSRIAAESLFGSAMIHLTRAAQFKRLDDAAGRDEAFKQAEWSLRRIIVLYPYEDLAPTPQLSLIHLSEILDQRGRTESARQTLEELADKFPNGSFAIYAKAMIAAHHQMRSDAVFLLNQLRQQTEPLDPQLSKRVIDKLNELEPRR